MLSGFRCTECGTLYPPGPSQFCPNDFAALEAEYDLSAPNPALFPASPGEMPGPTPLLEAPRLARALGVGRVWVKDEGACQPSSSFKDRAVTVALAAARTLGLERIACSSTGNLAHSVAACCARAGLPCAVLVPADVPEEMLALPSALGARVYAVEGNYDAVNRLCGELAFEGGWGVVNVNLRHFYVEGCKAIGHEVAAQLGRMPAHLIAPVASGSLLRMIHKGLREMAALGRCEDAPTRLYAAQPSGCSTVAAAVRAGESEPRYVPTPRTMAHSIAVGDAGDGHALISLIRQTGGWAAEASEAEITEGMLLLAREAGVLAEPAGGVVAAAARRLAAEGRLGRGDEVVLINPASGMKTASAFIGYVRPPARIAATREAFFSA
jgi:threonine synthase